MTQASTLRDLVGSAAEKRPERPALVYRDRPIAYSELREWIGRAAAAFTELGVRRGDRIALLVGNVPEFIYALHGAAQIGAVAVPLNVMLTPEELGYILADSEAKVVVSEIALAPAVLAVRDRVASIEHVLLVGPPPTPRGTRSFDELLDAARAAPSDAEVSPEDDAVIAYTAGTTADPKGAVLTHANLIANLRQISAVPALREAESDVVMLALPLFHIYALNVVLGVTLMEGATAVLVERFDPVETLEMVNRHRVSVLFGAPPMFQAWIAAATGREIDLSSVRLAVSGAAALPAATLEAFRERFGITIWEGYGLTEAAPAVTTNALGESAKADSIGLPLPDLDLRLIDEEGADAVGGDPGEIVVRGSNVFRGYWHKDAETREVLRDGWLHTGDIAYRDEDGYLFLVDRKKDLVIVSGFNVYPKEVEDAILLHPKVAECVVIGVADERTGEAVRALVVVKPGEALTSEELLDHCAGRLARFKRPAQIEFVEELPRHVTGKVARRRLRRDPRMEGSSG